MKRLEKILLILNIGIYFSFALFSYSYTDLNLTLSQNQSILSYVEFMQNLGYYNRSTSTAIFLILVIIAFVSYVLNLVLFIKSKISLRYLTVSTFTNTFILIFAYPFLSSDIFNYIFDAKIILNYQANPYSHRPLDFPNDEWLRFMRWTHRYSPYGPLWLAYSLIPAVLGFGKFILNFIAFKFFIGVFHLINSYLIFKILGKINRKYQLTGTTLYALNPTLLIEGVANAHNDIVLASFMLGSIYFLTLSKKLLSYVALISGALIKYIPILIVGFLFRESISSKKDIARYIKWSLITMIAFTFIFSTFKVSVPFVSTGATQVQFQPWYLFWTLPLAALLSSGFLLISAIIFSFSSMLRYIPYLYYGVWTQARSKEFMLLGMLLPIFAFFIIYSVNFLLKKILKTND